MAKIGSFSSQLTEQFSKWGSLVKFSHTVFALPFALAMLVIVSTRETISVFQILLILFCLVLARTGAMAFNRLLDRRIDAINPRTSGRELPQGRISVSSVWVLLFVSYGGFLLCSALLGSHTLVLAPFVIFILSFYSWTKRFTSFSHLVLGLSLAMAPGGVWYALTAEFALLPVWLMAAVLFWVAGFDIIYSCQDADFDRSQGLFSIPAKVGIPQALLISKIFHLFTIIFLTLFGIKAELGALYFVGVILFAGIIISQHLIVSVADLSRVNEAFFVRNGLGSVMYLIAVIMDNFV